MSSESARFRPSKGEDSLEGVVFGNINEKGGGGKEENRFDDNRTAS